MVVAVWPTEKMPIDKWGKRADIIMDGDSTIKRMNVGRVYEQYVNAVGDLIHRKVREMMDAKAAEQQIWDYLTEYYQTASPMMGELVAERLTPSAEKRSKHLKSVYDEGIYLWLPANSPTIGDQQIEDIRTKYPVPKDKVTYTDEQGQTFTTVSDILIGSMYIILLEKTGSDWAAVSSAKRQHFGLLAKLTNADKYSLPWREQPVRFLGESEVRLLSAVVGPQITADLLEIPNSPAASKAIVKALLKATKPTDIDQILNRKEIPRGISRSVMFVKHILGCAGFEFTNE